MAKKTKKLFALRGFYEPSYFHLKVNTRKSLYNLNQIPQVDLATFFHEYIHFLQDVSTPFGLLNSLRMIEYTKNLANKINKTKLPWFCIPIKLDNDFNFFSNNELETKYLGSSNQIATFSILSIEKVPTFVLDKDKNKLPVNLIKIKYLRDLRINGFFYFGALCIQESMSHIAQNIAFGTDHDDSPYKTAQIISGYLTKDPLSDIIIMALCDVSLFSHNPGEFFIDMIYLIEERKLAPNLSDIYQYGLIRNCTFQNKVYKTIDLYKELLDLNIKSYQELLTSSHFSPNLQWLETLLNNAYNLRINNPMYIIDIVNNGFNQPNLAKIMFELGTPFMTNKCNDGFFIEPNTYTNANIQPYIIKAVSVFNNICLNENKNCDLYEFCLNSNIVNKNCLKNPWARSRENNLCPLSQLVYSWGFSKKKPFNFFNI